MYFLWFTINCSNLLVISSIKCVLHAKEICDKPAQPSTSHRATNNLSGETGANVQVLPTVTNDFLFQMLELVCACRLIANNMKFNYRCIKDFVNLRTSEIHLFYNLQLFYWHFLEILWLFIFLVFYKLYFLSSWNHVEMEVKKEKKKSRYNFILILSLFCISFLLLEE